MAEETNEQQPQRPNPFRRKSFNRYRKPHGKGPRTDAAEGESASAPVDESMMTNETTELTVPRTDAPDSDAPSERSDATAPALSQPPPADQRPQREQKAPAQTEPRSTPLQHHQPQQRRGENQERRGEGQERRGENQDRSQRQRQKPQQQGPSQAPAPQAQGGGGRSFVTVVVPLLNEEESLRELAEQLKNALQRVTQNYEVIFIDDGSTDQSFKVLREINSRNRHMKAVRFRRNYGKSAAIQVGFQKAQGEFVITMDADLQDDPAEIPNLLKELRGGYDVVSGWKKKRRDPITKTIPSKFFNFVTGLTTGIKIHDFNCGLKGYKRDVVKSVNVYGELHRYIPALAHWLGFRIGEIPVNHRPRKYGKTKFGLGRFFRGFLDLLTLIFTTRFATRPLHLFGGWGIVSTMIGAGTGAWLAYEKFFNGIPLSNRPLFLVSLILIILGVQFVSIGLLGELITKGQQSEKEYSIREEIR